MPMTYMKEVQLKDGRRIVLRPLTHDCLEVLHVFLQSLPEADRLFLRKDVRDPALVHKWMEEVETDLMICLLAFDDDRIVGSGRILMSDAWMRHVGHLRLITATTHRRSGLGHLIARELVDLSAGRGLEKIQVQIIEDDLGAIKVCEDLGFNRIAVLDGVVKDQSGSERNLVIMMSDIQNLGRIMEEWIQDSMLPAFRVPGGGA